MSKLVDTSAYGPLTAAVLLQVAETARPDVSFEFVPTDTTLFRFSALTWNAHKIHLCRDFAQKSEGYPGQCFSAMHVGPEQLKSSLCVSGALSGGRTARPWTVYCAHDAGDSDLQLPGAQAQDLRVQGVQSNGCQSYDADICCMGGRTEEKLASVGG